MDHGPIWRFFIDELFADIDKSDEFYIRQPMLAHYTSLEVLEKILATSTMWFCNPLFMNDFEEVGFGINLGVSAARKSDTLKSALGTHQRQSRFIEFLNSRFQEYVQTHVFDTYVFCASEHEKSDEDGLLSMWRGYGGNGKGAAIVIDTGKLRVTDGGPLILAKVHYGSVEERQSWCDKISNKLADLIRQKNPSDDELLFAADALFERIKLFALFTKHRGFEEEREWRCVYLPERDSNQHFASMRSYRIGTRGIEPVLKFEIKPVEGLIAAPFSLEHLVERILIGPSRATPMIDYSIKRLLELTNNRSLIERVKYSKIPFRPYA